MPKNIVTLLFLISLSSALYGIPVNEETLQYLLDRQIKLPTNGLVTLRNLYGRDVNVHNFNPGDGIIQHLSNHPNSDIRISLTHIQDTEAAENGDVPFNYFVKAFETAERDELLLIKGDQEAGKTRALRMIELVLFSRLEPILSVYVDLPQILNANTVQISSSDNLLRMIIGPEATDFINNVAEVNPPRVKILMDNIDRISPIQREQVINAISELRSREIGVAVSSTINVLPLFNQRQMNPIVLDIPPLVEEEFEALSEKYWEQTIDEESVELHSERIQQYSKALQLMVFESPLPRSVGIVKRLLKQAMSDGFQPFPSLSEFVLNPKNYPNPRAILRLSDNMHFDKTIFYNQLLPKTSPTTFETEVYGIQAIKMLLKPTTAPILEELQRAIEWSNAKIEELGIETYKLIKSENGAPVDFSHPEYKRYYAAKYISDRFATGTPLFESFRTIIHNSKYSFVAEFINSEIPHLSHGAQLGMIAAIRLIAQQPEVAFQITDNLISHRLDILSSMMLKILGDEHILIEYISKPTILKSQNKYSFGMLAEIVNVNKDYYIPRKTPWMYSGNRIEMILNLKLTSSLQTLRDYGYSIDPNIELISAAKRSQGLAELLDANRERNYAVEVLNRAMYESIKALGPESIQNMRALKARGARPAKIDIGGRTLAHEAARWHNRELLEVIHKEFLVSLYDTPDNNGQTILFELLEHALPSNAYIQENAWESIAFLAEHGDLYVNEEIIKKYFNSFRTYTPPLDNVDLSYRSIIAYDDDSPAPRENALDTLRRFIPIEDVDIPREILSMRRLLITKNCLKTMLAQSETLAMTSLKTLDFVTVAELVLSHKPIENTFQFHHYQNAMKYLLTKKSLSFNPPQMERVCNIIVKNTHMAADFIKITQMIRNDVVKVEPEILSSIKVAYELRIQNRHPQIDIDADFESRALDTVYDMYSDIEYTDFLTEAAQIEQNFANEYVGYSSDSEMYDCVI